MSLETRNLPDANRAVVLLSGGLDSSTLLHMVRRRLGFNEVHAVSFVYGQRHVRELEMARWQAAAVGAAAHEVVDVSCFAALAAGASALVRGGPAVPDLVALDDAARRQPPTYVPNRNMVLLSLAAAYAEAHGAADVFYGAQRQDEYGYWDCTAEFVARLNAALALNRVRAVRVHAPFLAMRKSEIVALGAELGVEYAQTWSCYRGGATACGACPTCVERLRSFREAGLTDPLPYG